MNQQQAPAVSYPPPATSYPPPAQAYPPASSRVTAPPPMGYPTKDGSGHLQQSVAEQTTSTRGDGFWKGCCAAICCCWVLDICF